MSQESNFYDLEQVKSALSGRIDDFVMSLFPEAKKEASAYKIGGIDGHKGGSMMISTRSSNPGWFQDFANAVQWLGDRWRGPRLMTLALKSNVHRQWSPGELDCRDHCHHHADGRYSHLHRPKVATH